VERAATPYADTPTGRVDSFTFDPASGAFTGRRTFTEISGGGHPDGMAIDEEDGIWVALWGGSAVHRYDRAGRLDLVLDLPVSNVTACAFGPDLRILFITTSRQGLDPADQPDAGAVFRYEAGVPGAQQHAFAWLGARHHTDCSTPSTRLSRRHGLSS
jgi:sugar lactone lactonase YvrE